MRDYITVAIVFAFLRRKLIGYGTCVFTCPLIPQQFLRIMWIFTHQSVIKLESIKLYELVAANLTFNYTIFKKSCVWLNFFFSIHPINLFRSTSALSVHLSNVYPTQANHTLKARGCLHKRRQFLFSHNHYLLHYASHVNDFIMLWMLLQAWNFKMSEAVKKKFSC